MEMNQMDSLSTVNTRYVSRGVSPVTARKKMGLGMPWKREAYAIKRVSHLLATTM